MAKKIRFPLEMKHGVKVRNLTELVQNFSLDRIIFYLLNGKILVWLRDRNLESIAIKLEKLDSNEEHYLEKICAIFDIKYNGNMFVDVKKIKNRNKKLKKLSEYTIDKKYFEVIDDIAFDQKELNELVEEIDVICLCGDSFDIPLEKQGVTYIGINNPTVVIKSNEKIDWQEKNITLFKVEYDENYKKILLDSEINEEEIIEEFDEIINETTIEKFEKLIIDINKADKLSMDFIKNKNISLLLIYNYEELNEYGKIIIEQSDLQLNEWNYKYTSVNSFKEGKIKIKAAKELLGFCRMKEHRKEAYKFIFWSMLILCVDNKNKKEKLSLICDFARMLKILDDEMKDILKVIRILYYEKEDYNFKTQIVVSYFSQILELYN